MISFGKTDLASPFPTPSLPSCKYCYFLFPTYFHPELSSFGLQEGIRDEQLLVFFCCFRLISVNDEKYFFCAASLEVIGSKPALGRRRLLSGPCSHPPQSLPSQGCPSLTQQSTGRL